MKCETPEQRQARIAYDREKSRRCYLRHRERYLVEHREWKRINSERRKAADKKWRELNREKELEKHRRWYHNHIEEQRQRCREKQKREFQNNHEKVLERNRLWARNNPAASGEKRRRRESLIRQSTKNLKLISKWMISCRKKRGIRCYYCDASIFGKAIRFDHIVPIIKGGPHAIENLCCTCNHCNSTKWSRLISEWVKPGQLIFDI